jgi:hypothetical protein
MSLVAKSLKGKGVREEDENPKTDASSDRESGSR